MNGVKIWIKLNEDWQDRMTREFEESRERLREELAADRRRMAWDLFLVNFFAALVIFLLFLLF